MPSDKGSTREVYVTRSSFGRAIRERRRALNLTQEQVARKIKTSTPYVGHLEADKRHPSDQVLSRLADVLDLNRRELFFMANPAARRFLAPAPETEGSVWEQFRRDEGLRRAHGVTPREMEMLSRVALMGKVRSARDFIYILNTVRQALER